MIILFLFLFLFNVYYYLKKNKKMKTLTLILLSFISFIFAKQIFVKTGTGLIGNTFQWKLPGMREGSLFMAACVIGGLGSDKEMFSARKWAVSKGYIRGNDTYVNMSGMELAKKIAQNYGTQFHGNWDIKEGCNKNFWVIDNKKREVYNSNGLGYTGCK
jgi:hypothetical protein